MTSHERFEPDTHRSDETARRLDLVHEDRHVFNVSGCNVDPTAVEKVLNRHPNVARAAAIGVPDAGTGEAVKAFIVLNEGGSAEQILSWVKDPATGMARYLVPKHIEFRRSLPPTMDGEPETAAGLHTNGERRPMMLQKLRNRARQAVKGRIEINLDGLELDISPEDIMTDLNFGVGPIADVARLVREGRPEVGRVG